MVTLLVLVTLYFLPTMIAVDRRHRSALAIGVANLLLGWTILGWIFALIWSCTGNVRPSELGAP